MSNSNVISIEIHQKKNLPQVQKPVHWTERVPWQVNEATWALRRISLVNHIILTGWEIKFLFNMILWRGALSPKQTNCLVRICDKVEVETQDPPLGPDAA